MDIGLEGLLQIVGELEVNKRVLTEEVEKQKALIANLEQQLIAYQNVEKEPTPIVPVREELHAEDNVQASQD